MRNRRLYFDNLINGYQNLSILNNQLLNSINDFQELLGLLSFYGFLNFNYLNIIFEELVLQFLSTNDQIKSKFKRTSHHYMVITY